MSKFWLAESSAINPKTVKFCVISANLCYHSANLCYQILAGKNPSRKKQIWRPTLGKLREHFVKIWSEFYCDIASKMSVN